LSHGNVMGLLVKKTMFKYAIAVLYAVLFYHVCCVAYNTDLLIGDTKNMPPLKALIKLKSFPDERYLPKTINDSDGFVIYERPKVDQIISSGQYITIKIQSPNKPAEGLIEIYEHASFSGKTPLERSKSDKWNCILFEVSNSHLEWEEIPLYWGFTENSISVFGESEHFAFFSFQRNLPIFDNKNRTYKQTIEISLIERVKS
jgi:hypothetical protein